MELEDIDEVMEELLELEISQLFESIEGVTDVFVYDITIKGPVNGYILYMLWFVANHMLHMICITPMHFIEPLTRKSRNEENEMSPRNTS